MNIEKAFEKAKKNQIDNFIDDKKSIIENIERIGNEMVGIAEKSNFSEYSLLNLEGITSFEPSEYVTIPQMIRIGNLTQEVENENEEVLDFQIPSFLPINNSNGTSFLLNNDNKLQIHNLFQTFAIRLLLSLPTKLCKFYLIDNFSYGRNFNILNRLDKKVIGDSIITNQNEISKTITELEEIVKDANQRFLTQYEYLYEYNENSKELAEPYKFVFITNFPAGFSTELGDRLFSLLSNKNAIRAGIYIFFSIDDTISLPYGFDLKKFKKITTHLYQNTEIDYEIENSDFNKDFNDNFNINLFKNPPENINYLINFLNEIAKNVKPTIISLDNYFDTLIKKRQYWKENSTNGLKIPIGFINPREKHYLEFGNKTADYFALIGGLPGQGKTVLLHNIIINSSILYSPEELNFYLIDCKNGTGFKPYDKLPHTKILSISNDREFGASALSNIVAEIQRRANLFKDAGEKHGKLIEKINDYRATTNEKLPRIAVIVDEFQVLLEVEDKITRQVRFNFNKIFREGRAFGINVILCTQGIGRLDIQLSNVSLRYTFKLLDDIESERILGNNAATKLSQIGKAIMNNSNGNSNSNIEFQVSYTEKIAGYIKTIAKLAEKDLPNLKIDKFISDGIIKGRIHENETLLNSLINQDFKINNSYCDIFIGEPSFIQKKHCFIRIRKQNGSNLLIVGNDKKSAISIIGTGLVQLVKQSPQNSKFYILDFFNIGDKYKNSLNQLQTISDNVVIGDAKKTTQFIDIIEKELDLRIEKEKKDEIIETRVVLSLLYAQNARDLKKQGYSASPLAKKFYKIIKEGADYGIHVFIYTLNYKGAMNILDQSILGEFDNRIALNEGNSLRIITEQTSTKITENGVALLQAPDEYTTYNPDLFRVYSELKTNEISNNPEIKFINQLLNK